MMLLKQELKTSNYFSTALGLWTILSPSLDILNLMLIVPVYYCCGGIPLLERHF